MGQKGATANQAGLWLILRERGRPEQSNVWRPPCRVRHSRWMVKRKTRWPKHTYEDPICVWCRGEGGLVLFVFKHT